MAALESCSWWLVFSVVLLVFVNQLQDIACRHVVPTNATCDENHTDEPTQSYPPNTKNCSNEQGQAVELGSDNAKVDPYGSWNNFLGHTGNPRNNKKSKSKGKPPVMLPGGAGPPGPPGPPGPQGPAGAIVTEAAMMTEFRNLVRESAQKRSRRLAENVSLMAAGTPDLLTAFHVELKNEIQIPRKTLHELGNYRTHGHYGTFIRGNDVDFKSGRYMVRYTGIYQFTVNIHVLRSREANLRPRDNIKLRICITSLCNHNTSLMSIIGLNTNSKIFTTSLNGMLLLKAGQYVSVFIENSSGNPITITGQSSFSGILLGA